MIRKMDAVLRVLRDIGITLSCLIFAAIICVMLKGVDESSSFAALMFELAILVIASLTDGYFYGIAASVIGMFGVNFAYTYQYGAMEHALAEYPATLLCFLAVSIFTSSLTKRVREQERQRGEAEKEIVRANLLRSISHDFRTPLTTIIGSANTMLDSDVHMTDDERALMLTTIADEAEWLKRIVENLMSITRVNGDAGSISKSSEMAEEILSEAAVKFRRQRLPVELAIESPEELLFVPMDTMLIGQVLQNLLDNAVRHGVDTKRIVLSVARDGENAVFSVRDDGAGIESSKLINLQAGKLIPHTTATATDDTRNMGIGLSVCRTIIAAHGGSMTFNNNRGKGATVSFTLPLEKENACDLQDEDTHC